MTRQEKKLWNVLLIAILMNWLRKYERKNILLRVSVTEAVVMEKYALLQCNKYFLFSRQITKLNMCVSL